MYETRDRGQEENGGEAVADVRHCLGTITEDAEAIARQEQAAQRLALEQGLHFGGERFGLGAGLVRQGAQLAGRLGVGLAVVDLTQVDRDVVVGVALRLLAGDELLSR